MTLNNATGCKDYRMLGDKPTLAVYNLNQGQCGSEILYFLVTLTRWEIDQTLQIASLYIIENCVSFHTRFVKASTLYLWY